MLKTNSPFKAHFKSILDGQIVGEQAAAYEATKEITKYAEENNYNLSFTSHSLGVYGSQSLVYIVLIEIFIIQKQRQSHSIARV